MNILQTIKHWRRSIAMQLISYSNKKRELAVIKKYYTIDTQRKLVSEYNRIQTKQSNLSRKEREEIERTVNDLIGLGIIKVSI